MLKAQYRLRKTKDINAVLKKGRGFFGGKIAVKLAKNGLKNSRFAVVVGIKVSKSAVRRNRLRRQLREIIRLELENIKPGYDVMVMARPASLGMDFEALKAELGRAFKKVGLI